ncbi:MAG: extracellular solute-binding protein, partial [Oscillospiraceae bacterium]|nr:extracellular solute-binding protein [Oscillospiraceae bacterium]
MKKTISLLLLSVILCLSGCAKSDRPSAGAPVVLTMWHVYGSQTESPLNNAIDLFNSTVGKENGVVINVVSVTSSSAIDQALSASANAEPGAEELPDLFTAYPRVAQIVGEDRLLAWDSYFTKKELAAFHSEFLSEGCFESGLLMLPIAKSTEALFLNKTLFDRFSADTGVSEDDLKTVEGMLKAAKTYYDWSGGQNFIQLNDFYNFAYVGMKASGSDLISEGELQLNDAFERIWKPLAETA